MTRRKDHEEYDFTMTFATRVAPGRMSVGSQRRIHAFFIPRAE
mgnify:CR=1 FL=1